MSSPRATSHKTSKSSESDRSPFIRHRNRAEPSLPCSPSQLLMSKLLPGGVRRRLNEDDGKHGKNWCNKPRKWSLSSILLLMLVVASVSTLVINTATLVVVSSKQNSNPHVQDGGFSNEPAIVKAADSIRKSGGSKMKKSGAQARVVFLDTAWKIANQWQAAGSRQGRIVATMFPVDPTGNSSLAMAFAENSTALDMNMTNPEIIPKDEITNVSTGEGDLSHLDQCIPKAAWQTASFINCNAFHELDIPRSAQETRHGPKHEEQLTVLGEGWFRTAWKIDARNQTTVLKTLRIERDFLPEYYELHRRDAVAMERLTWSPFVVNVFGYCGNSAINEIADFPYRDVKDLEHFDRKMRYREKSSQIQRIKLQLAASIAQGVADIHSIDGPEVGVSLVHYDLNPRNIAIFKHGRPKINDLNIAEFLRYDPVTNRTCGFPNRMKQPWWRAPEEVNLTATVEINEKVDIYSLGAILFHILTTHSPRGKMKQELMEKVRADVVRGVAPALPPPFDTMADPVTMAFKKAMARCFVVDPNERATAEEIVNILFETLVALLGDKAKKGPERGTGDMLA